MRDFLPDDLRRREYVVGVIRKVYELYGFEPLETPAVENIETLLGKAGEEANKLIFKILKRGEHEATGEADLALRYDLTVPLARVVAEYQSKLPKFFKRYQIQPVWRADRPSRGRFREFYQCDVDIVGTTSPIAEAELCAAVSDVFSELKFPVFTIRLNHRSILTATLNWAGFHEPQHDQVLVAVDKLDKIGRDGVVAEVVSKGLAKEPMEQWLDRFSTVAGVPFGSEEQLARLRETLSGDPVAMQAVANLDQIMKLCEGRTGQGQFYLDQSLARGLSYYTGAIMEVVVPQLSGSLGGGGRYDNLVGQFLGRDIPACGFSLGLERILVVMTERNMFPESVVRGPSDVMITLWSEETMAEALELAATLRAAGLRVDVYPEVDKIGKQFKYASTRQVPFVVVLGDEERARGDVTIKDMRSGAQQAVNRQEAAAHIKKTLGGTDTAAAVRP
jgi:histidyl-tRNA synthetase